MRVNILSRVVVLHDWCNKPKELHHNTTSLVYQLVTSLLAGYQLVARDQLVTRLVRRLVVRVISRYLV